MKQIFTFFTLFTLFTFLLNSCATHEKPATSLITIDIPAALKTSKDFHLSEIVDSIEYIKLETRPECLISSASSVIGEKYIVLLNGEPRQVLLFDRAGKFIRLIGKIGKGPGEYTSPNRIDLSPDETRILIADGRSGLFLEFSVDGNLISSQKAPLMREAGPCYLDNRTVVFSQFPLFDSLNYPRIISMNLDTGDKKTLYFSDYRRNPERNAGYCLSDDFYKINNQVIFKDGLCDTVYQLNPELNVQPVFNLDIGTNTAQYRCMSEVELDSYDHVAFSCLSGNFLLLIGNYKERFHLVYNKESGEAFALAKLTGWRGVNDYRYGMINDLDGTGPYWFWYNANIRNNRISDMLQIPDLQEIVKSENFLKADLKINEYRDRLIKLIEESSENDNPIIRIMHLIKN